LQKLALIVVSTCEQHTLFAISRSPRAVLMARLLLPLVIFWLIFCDATLCIWLVRSEEKKSKSKEVVHKANEHLECQDHRKQQPTLPTRQVEQLPVERTSPQAFLEEGGVVLELEMKIYLFFTPR
jgi:hypothetical protein